MSKVTFLIVDDDFISRRLIIKILDKKYSSEEMEIIETEDGKQALEVLEKRDDIDIIFLDMNMPVMNGPAFLANLPEDTFIPIIVLTTDEKYKTEVLDSGATDFMVKPIQQDTLLSKIEDYLE